MLRKMMLLGGSSFIIVYQWISELLYLSNWSYCELFKSVFCGVDASIFVIGDLHWFSDFICGHLSWYMDWYVGINDTCWLLYLITVSDWFLLCVKNYEFFMKCLHLCRYSAISHALLPYASPLPPFMWHVHCHSLKLLSIDVIELWFQFFATKIVAILYACVLPHLLLHLNGTLVR